jgi:hypothetical protein
LWYKGAEYFVTLCDLGIFAGHVAEPIPSQNPGILRAEWVDAGAGQARLGWVRSGAPHAAARVRCSSAWSGGADDSPGQGTRFIFDPVRNPVLLIGGGKSGRWKEWYAEAIPAAEALDEAYLEGRR